MIAGSKPAAMLSELPTRSSPTVGSAKKSSSCAACLSSSKIVVPRLMSTRPYVVGSMPCRVRSSRRRPSVCSMSAIALDTAGWGIANLAGAFATPPPCPPAGRVCSSRTFRRRPAGVGYRRGHAGIASVSALPPANGGHACLFRFPGIVAVVPLLHESLPYDPVGDLAPISSAAYDFLTVAVTATLPVSSLTDLVAFARARPSSLNWAAAPGAPYLTFLEFQRRARLAMTYVSYRAVGLALPDLMASQIELTVVPLAAALPLARDGRIKLLAVTTPERAVAAPDLPTAIEAA